MSVSLLLAAVILMGATFVHEAGHWLAARLKGGRVVRLQIGRGPIVWRGRSDPGERGAEITLAPLPFGGRIDFEGVPDGTPQAVVAVSGPLANATAGVALFAAGAIVLGPGAMPGDPGLLPIRYAVERAGAWLWLVPRLIGGGLGLTEAPGVSLGALLPMLREGGTAGVFYVAGALSTLWGVLNLIPLPGVGSDGWHLVRALTSGWRRRAGSGA